ncbi:MAG TPA: FlgD immunoglobulin-like domain containing protein [Armatimonadota bacterium]|jgi:hypothetical protein
MRRSLPLLLACLLSASLAQATQTDNRGLHAVPAPPTVAIDGSLKEWDLSGQALMCYDLENLRDTYSARVALMYDSANLYVGIHWKDPRPLSNHHDPRYQAAKGWAADAVQLRFKTDRIAHVTAWYYADAKEPALQISYGDDGDPFKGPNRQLFRTQGWEMEDGAAMAFLKDPDGKGYVQEMRLPWKVLASGRDYRAGDTFSLGVELLWGDADWPDMRYADNLAPGKTSREFFWTAHTSWGSVTLEPRGNLKLPVPAWLQRALQPKVETHGPVPIGYSLPRASRVTIAIDDGRGRRVRTLLPALPRPKGKVTDYWDGLDDEGKPAPPGRYTFKGLYHDPIHLNWVLSYANPGNPPWQTPDGRGAFYGDHSAARSVATSGDYVALACPIGEAGQPLIGCDLKGQRLWGQANRIFGEAGIQSLATDGKVLWVGADSNPPTIYRVKVATGLYAPWSRTSRDAEGHEYQVLDLPVSDPDPAGASSGQGPRLSALAYQRGLLAVCLYREGRILLMDAETGDLRRSLPWVRPQSAAFDADGSLVVLFDGGHLRRVSQAGVESPFGDREVVLPGAQSVAVDAQRRVYVSVRGWDQNVKVYSPTGRLLREIGRHGGRPFNGPYDPAGMLNPAQIALDRLGRLWVTEESTNPKRTSVWDSRTGKLVKELVGTTSYAGAGSLNPFDPTMAFSDDTVYRIDLAKGTWRPVYSLGSRGVANDLFPPHVNATTNRVIRHGRDTLVITAGAAWGVTQCSVLRGGRWRSAAAAGIVLDPEELKRNQYAPQEVRDRFSHSVFRGHAKECFAWADRNGDGLVQANEMAFAPPKAGGQPVSLQGFYWGQLPGPDGTLIWNDLSRQSIVKLPISGYTACGAPVYSPSGLTTVKLDRPLLSGGEGAAMGGADGVVYLNQDPLMAVDAKGKVLFTYPSHHVSVHGSHTAKAARPGYLIGPSSILGTAYLGPGIGEVFDLNGNLGENYLFTRDGLLIQSLFRDVRGGFEVPGKAVRGMAMDATTAGGESFGGNFVRTADGRTYLTIGGTDARVLRVSGLESLRRFGGAFTYTPAQYVRAQEVARENAARAAEPKRFTVPRAASAPVIDGKADDWPGLLSDDASAMELQESSEQRYGRVQAAYDSRNLYLAYRVTSGADHPRNAGQDDRLLFKTGDAVDLMLGPEPQEGLAGDLRLLLTLRGGAPIAVLNQKLAPDAPASEHYAFTSPWRSIPFDRVRTAPEVKLAAAPVAGGYLLEAAVPWTLLGVTPSPGLTLRADVGILSADAGGTQTVARHYWSNGATGLVNDVPGEADLAPELWGTWELE